MGFFEFLDTFQEEMEEKCKPPSFFFSFRMDMPQSRDRIFRPFVSLGRIQAKSGV